MTIIPPTGLRNLLKEICRSDSQFRYARLAKNSGSHVAILAGLAQASGECAVFLAADLQDPPELILQMLDLWRAGHDVVWAVREEREGVSKVDVFLSNTFYRLLNLLGEVNLPPRGSDFALLDRKAMDALLQSAGSDPSIGGEIARLGFLGHTNLVYQGKAGSGQHPSGRSSAN